MLLDFYDAVIDSADPGQPGPKWTKGVYPAAADVRTAIGDGAFYLAFDTTGADLVGAFVLANAEDEVYERHPFPSGLPQADARVVHLLAVGTPYRGQGYASAMMEFVAEEGRNQGARAIRLDILVDNTPAARLYESCGYVNCGTVTMSYEDTGETECTLYELRLE